MTKFKTNKNKKAKAFTVNGVAALIIAAILALVFIACPNNAGGNSGNSGGETPTPSEATYEFVEISEVTITGKEVDPLTLPGTDAWWKGVFIKDRKVKLSPYKLGKTEVTYEL
ncbi:hypothetical protein HMPREF9721_02441 [Treponema denticola ATCC 35404]|nr:hypothetical protein HMPREF9721_02441 [Treponema denticola ATCC 35404]EMB36548.1 hypothetical protein HMPREF9735_01925 [Treponema denticola ATCC 33521]